MKRLDNPDESSELEVMSYNIQSLGKPNNNFLNLELFRRYINDRSHQPHVICLQETFLDAQQSDKSVAIKHYKLFRCDDNSRRAGVITYVRNDVKCELILSDSDLQLLIVQVEFDGRIIAVSNCYRRQGTTYIATPEVPRLTPKQYLNEYTKQHQVYATAYQLLLIGDYNTPTAPDQMPEYVKKMCDVLNVTPTIKTPTTQKRTRCIDNQFCSPELIKLVNSDMIFNPWKKPSSPHALICNKYRIDLPNTNTAEILKNETPTEPNVSSTVKDNTLQNTNIDQYREDTTNKDKYLDLQVYRKTPPDKKISSTSIGTTPKHTIRTSNMKDTTPQELSISSGVIATDNAVQDTHLDAIMKYTTAHAISLEATIKHTTVQDVSVGSTGKETNPKDTTALNTSIGATLNDTTSQTVSIASTVNDAHSKDTTAHNKAVGATVKNTTAHSIGRGPMVKGTNPKDTTAHNIGRWPTVKRTSPKGTTAHNKSVGAIVKNTTAQNMGRGPTIKGTSSKDTAAHNIGREPMVKGTRSKDTTAHNIRIGATLKDTTAQPVSITSSVNDTHPKDTTAHNTDIGTSVKVKTAKNKIPEGSHMEPKSNQHETDHCPHVDNKHTFEAKIETSKARTQEKQTSTVLIIRSLDSQVSQNLRRSRTNHRKEPVSKTAVSTHASFQFIINSRWIKESRKLGGLIKTTTKHLRVDVIGSTDKFTYEGRVCLHENPLYKKKTATLEGKNHIDPSQNYKNVKSKYAAGRGAEAAKNAGLNAAIDTAIYAELATDKGRPSLDEAAKTVATAAGAGFVNSVVPGGRLLTTLGTAIANQNYENLPVDLVLAATSIIPGNPIHFEREHTQANAPLFGNDLRSDNVNRVSADLSIPYIPDLASVGLCYDQEQIEFSRDGVDTIRNATAVNAHASLGTALDASLGFSSGTETSEAVTQKTADGKSHTTQLEKRFTGQFGARVRAADRKAAWDFGSAVNEVTTTTTITGNTDGTPLSVRNNLSLKYLIKTEDKLNKGLEATSQMHENYVSNESNALPTDGRVERIYGEQTMVKDSKEAYGLWAKGHKTEKYDVYEAEENAVHRSDRELSSELETTLTHQHAELSGRDLRESREETTNLMFFSCQANEKYQTEEKREKEVVQSEWTDKTRITSKKDGTAYDVRHNETTTGTTKFKEIEIDYYKKTQHLDTKDQITSTIGQKETISTHRKLKGVLQPKVKTTSHKVQQTFERIDKHTELQAPHLQETVDVTQNYGILKNRTKKSVKTLKSGTDKAEEQHQVLETLGGAAQSAVSSVTSTVLNMACNPAARTTRNVCNAVIDVGVQGAVGWAHSNVNARQNSPGAVAVAAVVTVAAHSVTNMTSSNGETSSTKEVLTDSALSSAGSIVTMIANTTSIIPTLLKVNAGPITRLIVRTGQILQDCREDRVNSEEVTTPILQEITFIGINYGIETYLIPKLVSLLPLDSLGASVVTCIAGTVLSFASFKVISCVTNKWRERRSRKEYERLCKDLGVSSTETDAAINSCYRRLALSVHPDKIEGDGTRFKKLTQDFQRLHQLRLRYNIQPDKAKTKKIIELLEEFLKDPVSFVRYLSGTTTASTSCGVPVSPLELMQPVDHDK